MLYLQIANSDDTCRDDSPIDDTEDKHWTTLVEGCDAKAVLETLVEMANDEEFSLENNWLRIKEKTT